MMTHVLSRDAIDWSRLTLDRPAAAKTGTSEEFRDGVVMGYTPDLSVGVWMGNADNTPMAPGTFSSAGTGPMWRRFMKEAHAFLQLPPRPSRNPRTSSPRPAAAAKRCSRRKRLSPSPAPASHRSGRAARLRRRRRSPRSSRRGRQIRRRLQCRRRRLPLLHQRRRRHATTDRVPVHGPGRGYSLQHRSEIRPQGDETSRVQRAAWEPRGQAGRCSQDTASGVASGCR